MISRDKFLALKAKRYLDVKVLGEEYRIQSMSEDGKITSALYGVAQDHCGYNDGDIEELVKNSEPAAG